MLAKAHLQPSSRLRALEAVTFCTYLIPREGPVAVALHETGVHYAKMVKEEGPEHNRGSPHVHKAGALVDSLHGLKLEEKDPGLANAVRALAKLKEGMDTGTPEEVTDVFKWLESSQTFDKAGKQKMDRLTIKSEGEVYFETNNGVKGKMLVQKIINDLIMGSGGVKKTGRAPMGDLERKLTKTAYPKSK